LLSIVCIECADDNPKVTEQVYFDISIDGKDAGRIVARNIFATSCNSMQGVFLTRRWTRIEMKKFFCLAFLPPYCPSRTHSKKLELLCVQQRIKALLYII
jgi:hypothetical protein